VKTQKKEWPESQISGFLTKEELRDKLNVPSTRMIDELMRKRKIPFTKLGHRTVRFEYEKVRAALEKFEHKAIGQK
jgi:excisionase family DNA binding protein